MEKTISQIYQTLQKMVGLHRQLLELVRQEREPLVNADLKAIHDLTCAKEAVIESIRVQEAARIKSTSELALILKRPMSELTLTNIIIAVQGEDPKTAESLRSTYNALLILIQRTAEQNKENRVLVERSLEHVHNMKRNVLGESVPRSDGYNQQGQRTNASGSSRLISKEV